MEWNDYLYDNNVLKNKFGIRDQSVLETVERRITLSKQITIPKVEPTYEGLNKVHKHLLGGLHSVYIGKNDDQTPTNRKFIKSV